jgi:hypothetical protein
MWLLRFTPLVLVVRCARAAREELAVLFESALTVESVTVSEESADLPIEGVSSVTTAWIIIKIKSINEQSSYYSLKIEAMLETAFLYLHGGGRWLASQDHASQLDSRDTGLELSFALR